MPDIYARPQYLFIRVAGEGIGDTIRDLEQSWRRIAPEQIFEFQFFDDYLNDLYISEQRQMSLVSIFAALCIAISCLGLFGLAAFTTQRRGRVMAIHKVLGATRVAIVNLIASEYVTLTAISILIAFPTTYFLVNNWLGNFSERVNQSFIVYLAGGIIVGALSCCGCQHRVFHIQ